MEYKNGFIKIIDVFHGHVYVNINHIISIYLNEENEFVIRTYENTFYVYNSRNVQLDDIMNSLF